MMSPPEQRVRKPVQVSKSRKVAVTGKRSGRKESRRAGPLARLAGHFRRGTRDGAEAGSAAASDLRTIAATGLFDPVFYLTQIVERHGKPGKGAERSEAALIAHYLRKGAALWLNPFRAFDTGFYLDAHPDLARSSENPLLHYIREGRAAGHPATADAGNWSSLDLPSALMAPGAGVPRKVFLVAATLAARNTTRYRARHLVELLGGDPPVLVDWEAPPDDFFAEIAAGAVVILQRMALNRDTSAFLHRVRAAATTIAYDIDDQIFDANDLEDWRIRGLDASPSAYARCMALADQFLVSTTALRDKVERRFRKPTHVVTNCLGTETVARSRGVDDRPAADGPFIVGYASGSHTHEADLAVALPAVERFLRANPDAEFHCIGRMEQPESLRSLFGERVRYRKAVPWPDLPNELARFSVQIVPLADCPFNRCKSHIRFVEAAAVGVPSIVSAVGEPGTSVFDGVTGLVCGNDTDAWVAALQALHDDAGMRRRLGEAARQFALQHLTTASTFLQARARRILEDLELGFLRDKLSIVVASDDAPSTLEGVRASTALPFEAFILGDSVGEARDNELVLDLPSGTDPQAGVSFLAGIAGERLVAVARGGSLPPLWDVRLVQAAKATGRPTLVGSAGEDDALAEGVMVAAAGVLRRVAAAWAENGDGTQLADYATRARRLGFAVEAVRGVLPRAPLRAASGSDVRRVAIKVCTPIAQDENVWGDTHYARGLKTALEALGYAVRIDKREEWHRPGSPAEVAIHLHGIWQYRPAPGTASILWIISHPEEIDAEFLSRYETVFCASEAIAARVRGLAPGARVATLPQCTDTTVFFPDAAINRDIDIAFVGNSRRIYRDAVRFAVEEGFDLAIWGTRWESFVDRRFIRGTSLTSREVADVYRRSKVVLNDHWDDQRREGLVNNRVFDVLACNTTVLSDANPGLATVLGGQVPTFADRAGLAAALRSLLADPRRDERAAALGAEVRRSHTFAERAAVIAGAIAAIGREPA